MQAEAAPAAGLRTIFRDREDVQPDACDLPTNARTSLKTRQVFMAGPDDGQVESAHLLTGGRYA